jgi:hypothetical protein
MYRMLSPGATCQLAAQGVFVTLQALQGVLRFRACGWLGRQRLNAGLRAGQFRQHNLAGMAVALSLTADIGGLWAFAGCGGRRGTGCYCG